jgi:RimJ/RimL family protein N-acetyltransferase
LARQRVFGMIDAAKYLESGTLKNGTAVRVRAIRADDKSRLSEAFRTLDSETIYKRFFRHKSALTDKELKAATEVDFKNEVALVVTIGEGESETIIGGARYAAFDAAGNELDAEVAFTVEEDYHGQGIACLLLRHLVFIARRQGVTRFEAHVLKGNTAMLHVFSRSGLPMEQMASGGEVCIILRLKKE